MTQVTVLAAASRRRDWSDEERLEILREAFSPGAKVQHVARRYDILIYHWRGTALRRAQVAFAPPAVIDDAGELSSAPSSLTEAKVAIVLELADCLRLRIFRLGTSGARDCGT